MFRKKSFPPAAPEEIFILKFYDTTDFFRNLKIKAEMFSPAAPERVQLLIFKEV